MHSMLQKNKTPNPRHHLSVASQLMEISPLMIRILRTHLHKAALGVLTHSQYRILANIFRGLDTVTQIALHHGVSQPTMTKTVNLMVEKKWLEKRAGSTDARQMHLKMTALGLKTFLNVKKQAQNSISQQLSVLSSQDLSVLNKSITQLLPLMHQLDGQKEKLK